MIIQKYDYKKLTRKNINGKRHYHFEGDIVSDPVPSVTSVLSQTKPQEALDGLAQWRKNVGEAKANQIMLESSSRGTRMHNYLEKYVLNDKLPEHGTNPYAQWAWLMATEIIKHGLKNVDEYWGTEVPLIFPKLYAGTTDLVGIHNGDEAIMDFKQSNKVKKREWVGDYFLQCVMYGTAHNEMFGTHIRKGVIMMCTQDCEYLEFIIEGKEWDDMEQVMWQRLEQFYDK